MREILKKTGENFCRQIVTRVVPHVLWRISIDPESKKREKEIRKTLKGREDLNAFIYFPHVAAIDPGVLGGILQRINPKGLIVAPMSHYNTENRPENKKFLLMTKIVKACGVETHRVVQTTSHKSNYTALEALGINRPYFARLKELGDYDEKGQRPKVSLMMSPTGTRSETGSLEGAGNGMTEAATLIAPALLIPLGIRYEGEVDRDGLNVGIRVNLSIGEPYLQEGKTDKPSTNELISRLEAIL
jgi:hypothetical protein